MRTIRVTGKGQIKVKPDITRITMTLTGVFKEYGETLRHSSEATEALKDVLSAFGFERSDLKTLSFHVDTEYESYRDKNNDYKRRFVGYQFNHALKVEFDGTEYHIYVPCGICGETHEAHCPPERVLRGATALGCAKTRQFCCFIGPEGTVEKNLRDLAVLAEKEHQQQEDGEEAFVDNVIMYEILSELKDIAARPDGITCACGSGRYGMEIRRSAVDLICRDCGAVLYQCVAEPWRFPRAE